MLKKIRRYILLRLIHNVGLPFLVRFRKPKPWYFSHGELRNFPEGTFGKELANLLDRQGYRLLRNYEHHDAKHVLLGYGMDEEGEVRMQFFFLGNRRYSFPVLSTVAAGVVLMPDKWHLFYREFLKGRSVPEINKWNIAALVTLNLKSVREKLHITEIETNNRCGGVFSAAQT
jgi:ubiquinone biosynthesis protein Coq4